MKCFRQRYDPPSKSPVEDRVFAADGAKSAPDDDGEFVEFFRGRIGAQHVFAHFERNVERTLPNGDLLRRLPASAEADATLLRCTVWGKRLDKSSVEFFVDAKTMAYLRDGVQGGWWMPLRSVKVVLGGVPALPTHIWTGQGGVNCGWIISGGPNGKSEQKFASSYDLSEAFDFCKGRPIVGGEMVSLSYKFIEGGAEVGTATSTSEPVLEAEPSAAPPRVSRGSTTEHSGAAFCRYVAWVTLDPRTSDITPYPKAIAEKIEQVWQSGAEDLDLGTSFFNAKVYLRVKGHTPFQRTAKGKRDVRRLELQSASDDVKLRVAGTAGSYGVVEAGTTVPGIFEKRQKIDAAMLIDLTGARATSSATPLAGPSVTADGGGCPTLPVGSEGPAPIPAALGKGVFAVGGIVGGAHAPRSLERGGSAEVGVAGDVGPSPASSTAFAVPIGSPEWRHPILDSDAMDSSPPDAPQRVSV